MPIDLIHHLVAVSVIILGYRLITIDLPGVWLPLVLWAFAQTIFNYFFVTISKNSVKDGGDVGKQFTLINIVNYFVVAIVLVLALYTDTPIWRYLEYIGCILPPFAGNMALCKLLFRAVLSERDENGMLDIAPYGINGCGPEVIGLGVSIVLYSALIIIIEKRNLRGN